MHQKAQSTKPTASPSKGNQPASGIDSLRELRGALENVGRQEYKATASPPKRVEFIDPVRDSLLSLPSVPTHTPAIPRENVRYRPHRFAKNAAAYTTPFCEFLTDNPTVFHAVDAVATELEDAGYKKLLERDAWSLAAGGKYYVERNGSSLIAFTIGDGYAAGNGVAMLAGHIDALTAKLKPIPKLRTKAGYVQLGVAPYAGGLNSTWWDRDLGIGGKVLVKESSGKIVTKLVQLGWPSMLLFYSHLTCVANTI